jgi:hypothetical protein
MRAFRLDSDMTTMRGTFYPTGWMVLMFPGEQPARDAAQMLSRAGFADDALMFLTPQDVREHLLGATGDDKLVPSAGTEGDTVRKFTDLAAQGHHGLMVHVPHQEDADRVMALVKDLPISYGQRYRKLVIEDLVA